MSRDVRSSATSAHFTFSHLQLDSCFVHIAQELSANRLCPHQFSTNTQPSQRIPAAARFRINIYTLDHSGCCESSIASILPRGSSRTRNSSSLLWISKDSPRPLLEIFAGLPSKESRPPLLPLHPLNQLHLRYNLHQTFKRSSTVTHLSHLLTGPPLALDPSIDGSCLLLLAPSPSVGGTTP